MKAVYRADEAAAWRLFGEQPYLHLAGLGARGQPVLRTFNSVVVDHRLVFHTGAHGETMQLMGQPVVAQVERPLGVIPSHFVDPELACPATTYFLSAQAEGVLEAVEDGPRKARYLQALMERHQPEGGHAPIRHDDRRYSAVLRGLCVAEIRPRRVVAKHKLGQNRSGRAIAQVQHGLWRRGGPGDHALIRVLHEQHPDAPYPEDMRCQGGARVCPAPDRTDARAVAELLREEYWWPAGSLLEDIVRAQLDSAVWLVVRGAEGQLLASARAHTDGVRHATLMDVVVHPAWRGRGLGSRLMQVLLDHPHMRRVRCIELRTRDQQAFYASFGFAPRTSPFLAMQRVQAR